MIGIFNSTDNPYVGSNLNDKAICISKSKVAERAGKPTKKTTHIITYNTMFSEGSDKVFEKLHSRLVNMTNLVTLSDKDTAIIFSKKDYNPFITERNRQLKDIFMISLDLKNRKILKVSDENIFILEGYILGGEFSLIASVNNFENTLQISLLDSVRKKIVVYTFGRDVENNALYMKVTEEAAKGGEKPEFKLKRFRPAKPTHTIVAYSKDIEQLKNVVKAEFHNIVEVSKDNMEHVIQKLTGENYKAITVFINAPEITEDVKKIYGVMMGTFSSKFKVYYELLNTGKVIKVRI